VQNRYELSVKKVPYQGNNIETENAKPKDQPKKEQERKYIFSNLKIK
jgi:hypothetical protein